MFSFSKSNILVWQKTKKPCQVDHTSIYHIQWVKINLIFFPSIFRTEVDFLYNNFEMQNQQKTGNFVQKLEKLLKSSAFSDIITWDSSKTNIDVLDIKRMEAQIIPKYFRHQKFQSFVRQLNLYGFRKVKVQGRHRFTHPILLDGQELTAISEFKCLKSTKGSKETVQSPPQLLNRLEEPHTNQVLMNSMENQREFPVLSSQTNGLLQRETSGVSLLPGQAIYMIPANCFNFWNYMQMIGKPNLPIMQTVAICSNNQ